MRRRLRRLLAGTSGANLLEAALITPLLLLLTLSIVEFGSLFYVYLALENGVTQATRYGVTGSASGEESLEAAMRQATPTLTIPDGAFTFSHLPPGGTTWLGGPGGPDDIEKMTIDYTWTLLTPLLRPFFTGGRVHFRVESARKNERRSE
jgi:TadE-like protein